MPDTLPSLATTYLAASDADERRRAFSALTSAMKTRIREEQFGDAAAGLRAAIHPAIDFTSAQSLCRIRKSVQTDRADRSPVRLAILGNLTLDQLTPLVELFLFAAGVEVELYTAPYGTLRQEILDDESSLYRFRPQITFLATSWRDLGHVPTANDDRARVNDRVQSELADWSALWRR